MINNELSETFKVLLSKKEDMATFFKHYLCERANIEMDEFVDKQDQFIRFIEFSLNTRQRKVHIQYEMGVDYFNQEYTNLHTAVKNYDMDKLKSIVYNAPGVGQKIGSLIIEIIFLYSNYQNDEILQLAFLPIDTHTKRILQDSFKLTVPNVNSSVTAREFIDFQNALNEFTTDGKSRVYFDYLWFIGKVFCPKMSREPQNRGYRICNQCWIKDFCQNDKWE